MKVTKEEAQYLAMLVGVRLSEYEMGGMDKQHFHYKRVNELRKRLIKYSRGSKQ